jgi:putative transcriptional regulator
MVNHDTSGAFGLVINRAIGSGPLNALLKGFGVDGGGIAATIRLHYGGPVEPSRGFVLHSSDYKSDATTEVDNEVSITTELDILKAIGKGNGPRHSLFALGYAGWSAGQLERELMRQDWLTAPADSKLIFDADLDSKWDRASAHAGLPL